MKGRADVILALHSVFTAGAAYKRPSNGRLARPRLTLRGLGQQQQTEAGNAQYIFVVYALKLNVIVTIAFVDLKFKGYVSVPVNRTRELFESC